MDKKKTFEDTDLGFREDFDRYADIYNDLLETSDSSTLKKIEALMDAYDKVVRCFFYATQKDSYRTNTAQN